MGRKPKTSIGALAPDRTPKRDPRQNLAPAWRKGQSGNPKGRKKGVRPPVAVFLEQMAEGEADELGRKLLDLARGGDLGALRLVLDRIWPPRKARPVSFALRPVETLADLDGAASDVLAAVAAGVLSTAEAAELSAALDLKRKAGELVDLEQRIAALEKAATKAGEAR